MNTPKEYQSAPQPRRQSKRILQQATKLPTQPPSVKVKRTSQQVNSSSLVSFMRREKKKKCVRVSVDGHAIHNNTFAKL